MTTTVAADGPEFESYPNADSFLYRAELEQVFREIHSDVIKAAADTQTLHQNDVRRRNASNVIFRKAVAPALRDVLGYTVEPNKNSPAIRQTLSTGGLKKDCNPDAYHADKKVLFEFEFGGAQNGTYYKHLIFASILPVVDYLVIAVPKQYTYGTEASTTKKSKRRTNKLFQHAQGALEAVFSQDSRLILPLKGVLLIGY